jgi:hypothetical protein
MAMQNKGILGATIVAIVVLVTAVALALLQSTQTLPNTGSIKGINVKVYENSACTVPLSSLTWGALDPGSSTIKTMYVKNEGTSPMNLSMTTTTWNPSNAPNYITVTWNQNGTTVNAGLNVQANVTLTVSPSISGIPSFAFTMVITGTG